MTVSKEDMKPLVQMLEESLVENEQEAEKLLAEWKTIDDRMNHLAEIHKEIIKLRDAFYGYAEFITPEKEQVNDAN